MATANPVNIAITGAGSQNTGLSVLASADLNLSAAGTLQIRMGGAAGAIVAEVVFAGAGTLQRTWSNPLVCSKAGTGTFFVVNSAGNVTGGVAGNV